MYVRARACARGCASGVCVCACVIVFVFLVCEWRICGRFVLWKFYREISCLAVGGEGGSGGIRSLLVRASPIGTNAEQGSKGVRGPRDGDS